MGFRDLAKFIKKIPNFCVPIHNTHWTSKIVFLSEKSVCYTLQRTVIMAPDSKLQIDKIQ